MLDYYQDMKHTVENLKRTEQDKQLANMAGHILANTIVVLFDGTVFTRLVCHSKSGGRYSGIRDGESLATFYASSVKEIRNA